MCKECFCIAYTVGIPFYGMYEIAFWERCGGQKREQQSIILTKLYFAQLKFRTTVCDSLVCVCFELLIGCFWKRHSFFSFNGRDNEILFVWLYKISTIILCLSASKRIVSCRWIHFTSYSFNAIRRFCDGILSATFVIKQRQSECHNSVEKPKS